MWEETECELGSVNVRRESDLARAFWLAFWVIGISDDWYRSTIGAVVKSFRAPGTVTQPIQEFQTNSERCLGSYWYLFEWLQTLSEIFRICTSSKKTLHVWCIDYCSLSTYKSYYSTRNLIQHSTVCSTTLRITEKNDEWFKNESR